MPKRKRIFTKFLRSSGLNMVSTGAAEFTRFDNADSWLVQEDIVVIGVQLVSKFGADYVVSNAGGAELVSSVSQVGTRWADGEILMGETTMASNGAAHLGYQGHDNQQVIFPEDLGIPVREEGYLYLHAELTLQGIEIGVTISVDCEALIYYIKE